MAVSDSHCNAPSEFSDRKRCKEEENPQTIASPEQGGTRKRKRRRKKNEESNEEPQGEVSPKPLLDTVIPQGENAEATTQNPNPTPQKKETKKNVQGEQQLQTGVEPDITKEEGERQGDANGNGGLCPKPLLDTSIPIAPQEGIAETTSQKANPMPRKRKKKNVQGEHQLQTCDPSIPIVVEPDVTKEEGAQQGDAKSKHGTAVLGLNEERPVPDSTPLEDTPGKKRSRKKKNVIKRQGAESEPEQKESNNTENPQQCSLDPGPKNKLEKGADTNAEQSRACPEPELARPLDIAIPIDSEVEKRAEPTEAKVQHPQVCSKPELACPIDLLAPVNLEKKKEVEPSEARAQHPQPQPFSKHETAVPGINEERPVPDPTTPEDTPHKKKSRKKKNVLKLQGAEPEPEPTVSSNTEHPQQCSPESELKIKMKKEAEANAEHSRVCSKPELSPPLDIGFPNDSEVEKRTEPTEAKVEHPQSCSDPKLASPIDLPTPMNLEKKKEAESSEAHAQHPQPQPCSKHETAGPRNK
ncbi:proteoglycan 4 isoform X1 [Spatholobus suberectus]|nr:proteoglycan 4 isoform X1 [Spatholobus suberectus]